MNSCLYECDIMHCRITPKRHQFTHRFFMFYLDLDEIDDLSKNLTFLSRNKFNVFNFRDSDHLGMGASAVKENILKYIATFGLRERAGRVMLLTNLRTMGHIFNPVSFYFCFDQQGIPLCAVAEIGNTFGERKLFMLGPETFQDGVFRSEQIKYYYISPFIDLDIPLDFQLRVPGEALNIKIDDIKDAKKFLYTTMSGPKKELNNGNLLRYAFCFPFITLKVIGLIHIHAFLLWLKGVPYHAKEADPHLQREVHCARVKK